MHSALAGDKITALENLEALKRTDTFWKFIPMAGLGVEFDRRL